MVALGLGASGQAVELVRADPWRIIHIAKEYGTAHVGRDALREPMIEGAMGGVAYRIVFHECYLGRDCRVLMFQSALYKDEWASKPPAPSELARWNREKLFGRAYRDDGNRMFLEHPVTLEGGVPVENLKDAFMRWQIALEEFSDFIDF
jgi:hypothetical protein